MGGDCPNITTNCTSPNGLPSYQEYIYEGNVTLTEVCNSWRFWVNINARNPMNFLNSNFNNVNLFVETVFNNTISAQDDSPEFNRLPVPYCCINTPFTYDNSASDVDGDSLVYESIMPRTHPTFQSCPSTPPVNCTYPNLFTPLNPTTNPLPCNNTFAISSTTGLFSMIPSQIGKGAIAIKVSQYRNGQLLGYIVRDIQTIVLSCNISSPSIAVDTSSLNNCTVSNDTITACAGNGFNFCFSTKTSDPTSILTIQSSLNNFSQPVSLTHSNSNTDSMYSCFNWTPGNNDTGWHYLNLFIVDSICRPIGVLNTDTLTKVFPIYIAPLSFSIIDTAICEPWTYDGYSQSGTYVDTLVNQYGCDSIRTLNLTVNLRTYSVENKTICAPSTYMGYGQSGTYIDTFVNQLGCDSIHTLNLLVNPFVTSNLTQTICAPNSYLGYSQTGIYIDTFQTFTGCDSIRTLNLTVNPISIDTVYQTICEPSSYLGYLQSGIYIDTFSSATGCDSIRILNLTVNARSYQSIGVVICEPGNYLGYSQSGTHIDTFLNSKGCDSIHTLYLSITPIVYQTVSQTICAFDTYQGYNQSGTYVDTFTIGQGCDSIRTLNLNVLALPHDSIPHTICEPSTFQGYGQSGVYIDTFLTVHGCDSLRTLFLTVNQRSYHTTQATICQYDSYLGYTQTGTYIDTFLNDVGCDSIHTLALYVNAVSNTVMNQTICQTDTFQGYSQSGVYVDTFTNMAGCDSVQVLNLTVTPILTTVINQIICEPDSFMGYSQTGTYVDTFLSVIGCDSIRTINLVANPVKYSTIYQTICEPNSFQGYSQSGIYIDTFVSAVDCDSIRTLQLTVNPITFSNTTIVICAPNTFWGYSQSGSYVDTLVNALGCDSVRTLNLTVNPTSFTLLPQTICEFDSFMGYWQTGVYLDTFTNVHGCDSVRQINLTVLLTTYETIDTSICAPAGLFGYNQSGTYVDTLANTNGCLHVRTLNLAINYPYFLDTTITLCQGEVLNIGGQNHSAAGIYYDSLLTVHGCDSVIKITINVIDIPKPVLGPNREICDGEQVSLFPGFYDYYWWNDGDTNAVNIVSSTGRYIVKVQNRNNRCFKKDTIHVNVIPYPNVRIDILDDPPCIGTDVTIVGRGATYYEWYLPLKLFDPISTKDTLEIYANTTKEHILLVGWDIEHCKDSARVDLLAEDCCSEIVIPNAFTPNGDGLNDKYGLVMNPQIEKLEFSIYNRWGNCIFKTNSFEEKWDGNYKGQHCEIGTYFYMIKAKCFTEHKSRFYKGDVNLIR